MVEFNTTGEVLQDIIIGISGKERELPWRAKKMLAMDVANSFHRIADRGPLDVGFDFCPVKLRKTAFRVWYCAKCLMFWPLITAEEKENGKLDAAIDPEKRGKVLRGAEFCKERMCPMCGWRRSIKIFTQVSKVMDVVQERCPELVPIFLTLTVRNCTRAEFHATVTKIMDGWKRMHDGRKFRRVIQGWFRALEVTVNPAEQITPRMYRMYRKQQRRYTEHGLKVGDPNPEYDTLHPHFHAILLVEKSYFDKDNPDYIHTTEWVQMWRAACGLDYDPICDIRKVRKTKEGRVKVAEVAKYTLKDGDYVRPGQEQWMDNTLITLKMGLRNRRLVAFGGVMKEIFRELGMKIDDDDLVNVGDDTLRGDVAQMAMFYEWTFEYMNYLRRAD